MTDIPEHERPLSEQFRIVARQYADAEAAATILEETKNETLAKMIEKHVLANGGDMAHNKAERHVRASDEWYEHKVAIAEAKNKARLLRLQLKYIEMKHGEWRTMNANARSERQM